MERPGESAYLGLPEREADKIADMWARGEVGLELSVEVHAPVVIGIYPMRIARFITDGGFAMLNGNGHSNGHEPINGPAGGNGHGQLPHPDAPSIGSRASRPSTPGVP